MAAMPAMRTLTRVQ